MTDDKTIPLDPDEWFCLTARLFPVFNYTCHWTTVLILMRSGDYDIEFVKHQVAKIVLSKEQALSLRGIPIGIRNLEFPMTGMITDWVEEVDEVD